jgi:hypothetical protein
VNYFAADVSSFLNFWNFQRRIVVVGCKTSIYSTPSYCVAVCYMTRNFWKTRRNSSVEVDRFPIDWMSRNYFSEAGCRFPNFEKTLKTFEDWNTFCYFGSNQKKILWKVLSSCLNYEMNSNFWYSYFCQHRVKPTAVCYR